MKTPPTPSRPFRFDRPSSFATLPEEDGAVVPMVRVAVPPDLPVIPMAPPAEQVGFAAVLAPAGAVAKTHVRVTVPVYPLAGAAVTVEAPLDPADAMLTADAVRV